MKLVIPVDQKASIAAGFEAPHSTEVFNIPAENIPQHIRQYIADRYDPASGKLSDYAPSISSWRQLRPIVPGMVAPLSPDTVLTWLESYYKIHQEAMAEERNKDEDDQRQRLNETLDVLQERKTKNLNEYVSEYVGHENVAVYYTYKTPAWPHNPTESVTNSSDAGDWEAELEEAQEQARAEAIVKLAALVEQKKTKAECGEKNKAARKQKLADWVNELGTDSQQERLAADLLPEAEVLKAMRKLAIPFPAYHGEENEGDEFDGVPEEAYAEYKKIKDRLPEDAEYRFCIAQETPDDENEYEGDEPEIVYAVEVTVPYWGLTFKKLLRLGEYVKVEA